MLGDLNASHMGISGGGGGGSDVGRLGLRFDRQVFEATGHLQVTEVVMLGPAAVSGEVQVGDFVRSVHGTPVAAGFDLDATLAHTVDARVEVTVSATADGPPPEFAWRNGRVGVARRPGPSGAEGRTGGEPLS